MKKYILLFLILIISSTGLAKQYLAVSSGNGTVKIWDADGWKLVKTLKGIGKVLSVAWSPDGEKLVVAYKNRTVKIWSIKNWKVIKVLIDKNSNHEYEHVYLAWSPNGKQLLFSFVHCGSNISYSSIIKILDTESWKDVKTFTVEKSDDYISSVAWSPDGKQIGAGFSDGDIKILDAESCKVEKSFNIDFLYSIAWSPDGKKLAAGSNDRTVKIWNTKSWKLVKKIIAGDNEFSLIFSVAWSPDGKLLFSGNSEGVIKIWNAKNWKFEKKLITKKNLGEIISLKLSPDGKLLASVLLKLPSLDPLSKYVGTKGFITIWSLNRQKVEKIFTINDDFGFIAWSPNEGLEEFKKKLFESKDKKSKAKELLDVKIKTVE